MENDAPVPAAVVRIPVSMLNRHGLVAGATGTGKTKTLQLMAEQISAAGVPVFAADIKGDLSGIASPGAPSDKLLARTRKIGQDWQPRGCPTEFFALGGQGLGIPLRATMSSFGPVLLAKVLGLNEVQESSLGLVFHYADQEGLPLLDLKDLRAVLTHLTSDEGKAELKGIGGLSAATVGVILRTLITFSDSGRRPLLRRAGVRHGRPAAGDPGRSGRGLAARAAEPGRAAGGVLHLLDVAAGRPLPRAARGRRHRQAQAGLLLRRGAPAVRRRLQGVPGRDRPDRAADPLQGGRHLLRHPDPEGCAGRRPGPARFAGPAPAPGPHARTRPRRSSRRWPRFPGPTTSWPRRCSNWASARRSSP